MVRQGRKISGGKYKKSRKKKLYEKDGQPRNVKLGPEKRKLLRIRGGKLRAVLFSTDKANIVADGKAKVVKIKNVLETPADKFLARTNALIKGAIIETEIGKAKITNRPSQEGFINAVLIE
ncbi:30S ribosomal protein S8e [Candidatus Pacearchaeota archaeon]|nr:30S ribosomal protein S8e [Candidatus Pacearchaeota archaeon]